MCQRLFLCQPSPENLDIGDLLMPRGGILSLS